MHWSSCRNTVLELVEKELRLAHELAQALVAESDALRQMDPETLDRATIVKQHCVDSLNNLDTQRRQLCNALGLAPDHDGMNRLLAEADDPGGELSKRWQMLIETLTACSEANERNGAVVSTQKRRVTEALCLLRGEPEHTSVYDASGEMGERDSRHVHAEI